MSSINKTSWEELKKLKPNDVVLSLHTTHKILTDLRVTDNDIDKKLLEFNNDLVLSYSQILKIIKGD
jgi:hypothetical protein